MKLHFVSAAFLPLPNIYFIAISGKVMNGSKYMTASQRLSEPATIQLRNMILLTNLFILATFLKNLLCVVLITLTNTQSLILGIRKKCQNQEGRIVSPLFVAFPPKKTDFVSVVASGNVSSLSLVLKEKCSKKFPAGGRRTFHTFSSRTQTSSPAGCR